MKITVKMNSTERILGLRQLVKDGGAQKFFTHQFRMAAGPYVPFRLGNLEGTAVERAHEIEYIQPYARRQYYENAGSGIEGTAHHGLRGKQWDKRMWADRGPQIVKAVANFVGGRPG